MSNLVKRWSRLAAAALFMCAGALHAQSDEQAAYLALLHIPIGGLAPLPVDGGLSLRYGHVGEGSLNNEMNNLAGTLAIILPDGETMLAVTLGGYDERCPDAECDWKFMGGVGIAHGFYSRHLGAPTSGGTLDVGLDGELGWGSKTFGTSWWGGRIGLPASVTFSTGFTGVRVKPYLTPSVAYGHAHLDLDVGPSNLDRGFGAVRPMIGGGLELASAGGGVRATFGFTRIAVSDGKTGFGASLSVRP